MSRYIQRCAKCKQVRGNSQFSVEGVGVRASVCRWCEAQDKNRRREVSDAKRSAAKWMRKERELSAQLTFVRKQLAAARGRAVAADALLQAMRDEQRRAS